MFTPVFVALQNRDRRTDLVNRFRLLSVAEKASFETMSCCVVPLIGTTNRSIQTQCRDESVLFVESMTQGDTSFVLLKSNSFFRFCFDTIIGDNYDAVARTLSPDEISRFMSQASFTVLDFKLRPYKSDPPNLLGLFSVTHPTTERCIVEVHVHFGPTSDTVGVINLMHFEIRVACGIEFKRISSKRKEYAGVPHGAPKWPVDTAPDPTLDAAKLLQIQNAQRLVRACRAFVRSCQCSKCTGHDIWTRPDLWTDGDKEPGHFDIMDRSSRKYLCASDIDRLTHVSSARLFG